MWENLEHGNSQPSVILPLNRRKSSPLYPRVLRLFSLARKPKGILFEDTVTSLPDLHTYEYSGPSIPWAGSQHKSLALGVKDESQNNFDMGLHAGDAEFSVLAQTTGISSNG